MAIIQRSRVNLLSGLTAIGTVSSSIALLMFCGLTLVANIFAQEPGLKPLQSPAAETFEPEKPTEHATKNPTDRPANQLVAKSREQLKILNIDQQLFYKALQGSAWGEEDLALLLEMLFRLPLLDIERIEELVQALPAWEKLNAETPRYLGGVYRLRGIVKNFEDLTPPEFNDSPPQPDETLDDSFKRLASRRTIPHVYRTEILVSGKVLRVYSNRVPLDWLNKKMGEAPLAWQGDQEVEVWGYLLKRGSPSEGPAYYFAAPRVRWYPNTTLGQTGFDYELLDDIRQKQTLLNSENELFYELLATAKRTSAETYRLARPQENEIVELWEHPENQVGNLLTLRGHTKHVARIAVEDPALAKRLGFDHYYYMELFVTLKIPTIVQIPIQSNEDDENKAAQDKAPPTFDKIYFDSLPLVFYFHELPPDETVQSLKNKQVQISGFFLKSWRYQSNVPLTNKQHASLFAPLLMGSQPEIVASSPITGANIPGLLILSVITASVLAGIFYLWLNQHDRSKRPIVLPEKIEIKLDDLNI